MRHVILIGAASILMIVAGLKLIEQNSPSFYKLNVTMSDGTTGQVLGSKTADQWWPKKIGCLKALEEVAGQLRNEARQAGLVMVRKDYVLTVTDPGQSGVLLIELECEPIYEDFTNDD